ncbi:MAG: tetratricopeptide repeat protein [Bacteroidales bacterium]
MRNKNICIILIAGLVLGTVRHITAQETDLAYAEKTAQSFFQNKDYRSALNAFNRLYQNSPQNAGYQYYIGRCMVELDDNTGEAINYLRFAAVKSHSADAWFYLGQAYYQNSEYEKAISSYKRFISDGKKAEIKRLAAKDMLAKAEKGQSEKLKSVTEKSDKENISFDKGANKDDLDSHKESMTEIQGTSSADLATNAVNEKNAVTEPLNQSWHNTVGVDDNALSGALQLQLEADSLKRMAKIKRAELKETEGQEERTKLFGEISSLEKESGASQAKADIYFRQLQEQPVSDKPNETVHHRSTLIELKEEINGIKVYRYKTAEMPEGEKTAPVQNNQNKIKESKNGDVNVLNEFSIGTVPAYDDYHPIPFRKSGPGALIYYIQLGVFSKKLANTAFGGITPVCVEEIMPQGMFKYYAGRFGSVLKAEEALSKIKQHGYPDAFLVAFFNNGQIPVDKARQIEFTQIKL